MIVGGSDTQTFIRVSHETETYVTSLSDFSSDYFADKRIEWRVRFARAFVERRNRIFLASRAPVIENLET